MNAIIVNRDESAADVKRKSRGVIQSPLLPSGTHPCCVTEGVLDFSKDSTADIAPKLFSIQLSDDLLFISLL